MKKLFLIVSLLIGLIGCSQENKKSMNTDINSSNITEKVAEQVKRFPKEPVYQVFVKNSLCVYELLVNDYPIANEREYGQLMTPFTINNAILKSGKQKITLRLYPAPAEYSRSGDVLSPNVSCNLEIEYVDKKDPEYKYIPVTKFELPTKDRMAGRDNDIAVPEFEGAGKKYYEITYEFDAQIPYENEGWSKGQDLTKLDQKLLEKKVVEFYNDYKDIYSNNKADLLAKHEYSSLVRDAIAEYMEKKDVRKIWEENIFKLSVKKEWLPFNYKIKYYGNGKIISLLQKSESDNRLIGESALAFTYKKNNSTNGRFIGVYLYLPEGKNLEDGLEVIR